MSQMTKTKNLPDYTALLRKNFAALTKLLDKLQYSLDQQKIALVKNDGKLLQENLVTQTDIIEKLETKQKELQKVCQQFKLPFTRSGILKLIHAQSGSVKPELAKEWQQLATRLRKARRVIEIQQKVVHHSQKSVEELLNRIKGQVNRGELYQSDGKKIKGEHHHLSTQA